MALELFSNNTYLRPGISTVLSASGGVEPYVYSILSGGGSVTASGKYTTPIDGTYGRAVVQVMDDNGATAGISISTVGIVELMCQILQKELGLSNGRVWLYNQKIEEPKDQGLYIVIRESSCKSFANNIRYASGSGLDGVQSSNFRSILSIDIKSRGLDAMRRKEEVVMALGGQYAVQMQELNSFRIGKVPNEIPNIGELDGSAIPYRFNITVNVQYSVTKTQSTQYFDTFSGVELFTND